MSALGQKRSFTVSLVRQSENGPADVRFAPREDFLTVRIRLDRPTCASLDSQCLRSPELLGQRAGGPRRLLRAGLPLFKTVLALDGTATKKGAFMRGLATVFVLTLAAVSADRVAAATPQYDVVIRGGTVYDGSGGTPYTADIAVKGDRIAAIAPPSGRAWRDRDRRRRQGGVAGLHQHAGSSGGKPDRRWPRSVRSRARRHAGGDRRRFHGAPDARDEAARGAARGRYQIPGHLDDARRLSRHAAEERYLAERRLVRRRGHRAHQPTRRSGCPAYAAAARGNARTCQAGDGGRGAGLDRRAHLFAQHLCQDARADRAGENFGAMRRHLYRPSPQRRRPAERGGAGDHRHRRGLRRARRDLSLQAGGAFQLGQARRGSRDGQRCARPGRAHYGRHVHLHFRRDGPRCGDAILGAGWWAREMDRAA